MFDYGLKKVQNLPQPEPAIMEKLFSPTVPVLGSVHPQEEAVVLLRRRCAACSRACLAVWRSA
jgi:hypothetical protein